MKNYQKLHYSNYQQMLPNGDCVNVTRLECFAKATPPTVANPFRQRWFYDHESGLAIRLPRNKMGDDLGKRNAADLKAEERRQAREQENCPGELDGYYENGEEVFIELEDEAADIHSILEDKALLDTLFSVLDELAPDDRELWELMTANTKKQSIADHFNITLDGVRYRENRLKSILRSNGSLKSLFEKD